MGPKPRSSRPGPHRLPADVLAFEQRERLMAALATAVHEKGYEETTITDIVTSAAIARPTFYKHFADKEECFLATFDALEQHVRALMESAAAAQQEWPDQVAAALVAALRFFAENPEAGRVCLVDFASLGGAIRPRIDAVVEWIIATLDLDRAPSGSGGGADLEPIGEPVVMGVFAVVGTRIAAGEMDLEPIAPDLIESVLGPYLGYPAAAEVAARHDSQEPD